VALEVAEKESKGVAETTQDEAQAHAAPLAAPSLISLEIQEEGKGMARYGLKNHNLAACSSRVRGGTWWAYDVRAWYENGAEAVTMDPHTGAVTVYQRGTNRTLLSTAGCGSGVLLDARGRLLRSWPASDPPLVAVQSHAKMLTQKDRDGEEEDEEGEGGEGRGRVVRLRLSRQLSLSYDILARHLQVVIPSINARFSSLYGAQVTSSPPHPSHAVIKDMAVASPQERLVLSDHRQLREMIRLSTASLLDFKLFRGKNKGPC
jgi:hypothetical protein